MDQWLDVEKTTTNCPLNRRVSSPGNCVNAGTESVIGHYGQITSTLRRASAVKKRPSSAQMAALSVAMFRVRLDKLYNCCVIILFIATVSLSEYDVNKNVITEHKCMQCVFTYVTRHQLAVLTAACVCLWCPTTTGPSLQHEKYDSFTGRVPVLRQIHGCVFSKCRCNKIQRAQL